MSLRGVGFAYDEGFLKIDRVPCLKLEVGNEGEINVRRPLNRYCCFGGARLLRADPIFVCSNCLISNVNREIHWGDERLTVNCSSVCLEYWKTQLKPHLVISEPFISLRSMRGHLKLKQGRCN